MVPPTALSSDEVNSFDKAVLTRTPSSPSLSSGPTGAASSLPLSLSSSSSHRETVEGDMSVDEPVVEIREVVDPFTEAGSTWDFAELDISSSYDMVS